MYVCRMYMFRGCMCVGYACMCVRYVCMCVGYVCVYVWCVNCGVCVCDVSCIYMSVQVHIPLYVASKGPPHCLETRFFSQTGCSQTWLTGLKGQNPYVRTEAASRNVRGRAELSGSLRVWPARSWNSLVSVLPVLETQAAIFL